jgi:hypothetical protein
VAIFGSTGSSLPSPAASLGLSSRTQVAGYCDATDTLVLGDMEDDGPSRVIAIDVLADAGRGCVRWAVSGSYTFGMAVLPAQHPRGCSTVFVSTVDNMVRALTLCK